jgi:glycerate dehydrogenase
MKIVIFNIKDDFTSEQQAHLSSLGQITYTQTADALPTEKLLEMATGADIICCGPEPLGGFEQAKEKLSVIINSVPNLKGICLSTTSFGWVDLDLCKKRGIVVTNVPGYSKESVAEQAIAFLLGAAKRIFISDRKTAQDKFVLDQGIELKGKTLGIIGLGNIGSRTAELAKGIGMNVIAFNRNKKSLHGVETVSLDELFARADAISLHVTHETANHHLIGKKEIDQMKKGVFIVNTADRELVDEEELAKALQSGKVDTYVYEGEDLIHTPLAIVENAIGFKGFAWYTKESLQNLFQIWVDNIITLAKDNPQNRVA